jgi:predicted enzyme related to lactoylglutathione lyase
MDGKVNVLNWFEVPALDINRAKKFYETIFGMEMHTMEMGGMQMAFFPMENMSGKVSGALVQGDMYKPSKEGAVIYLNGNPDLNEALGKVEAAGGKIILPKTQITPEIGYMAFFDDCEGNRMALHSQK